MKISGFKIDDFAKDIYTEDQSPEAHNLNGGNLLIHGPNTSGKSLTFNAIQYAILGVHQRLGVRPGGGNNVTVTFDDGSQFTRGDPKRKYSTDGDVLKTREAEEALRNKLGNMDVVQEHFLPSHLDQLPLEHLDGTEILDLILEVTNKASKRRIEEIRDVIGRLDEDIIEKSDRISPLKNRKRDLDRNISNLEGYQSQWEQVLSLSQSGELEVISEKLSRKEDIHKRLSELSSKKRGLDRKINQKEEQKDEIQRYQSNIEDIIIEALKEFVCPVCDQRVSSNTGKKRLDNSECPFCGENHSIESLKTHLKEKKSENEGEPERLATEISEHQAELNDIEAKISDLESEIPEISKLNSLVVDRLDDGKTVSEIEREAEKELEGLGDELNEKREELEHIESELIDIEDSVSELEDKKEELRSELEQLESGSYDSAILTFEETWTKHFRELSDEPEIELQVNRDSGAIALPSSSDERRLYDRRGDLSDSELQLLNLSFILALNEHGNRTSAINWGTMVLDEPFSNLDAERRESSLSHLVKSDPQIILTSSDSAVINRFEQHEKLELKHSSSKQTTFSDQEWGA
ncbi:AAA family ATPase [Halorubrum sp. Ea8]|uniref:AAA family ATPase n=1 Tax=Halorubrum sp. Ea8 TaxID=1383841 RepID=UPI000B98BAB8|nr:AAA family ATPase [Halorubrum sp. Ea8]OYR49094.1 hypothetical protein DJ74_09270 [Halorubrum sp. Ea8]